MKLIAEIAYADLLFKLMHQLGATFYRSVDHDTYEVVYFSGEKVVHWKGQLTTEQFEVLKSMGWPVTEIEVSEAEGLVKIKQ